MNNLKKVAVIGGGTGTFVDLVGLKNYSIDLSAIITMTDSGGSSGKLRDQYGVLPPGDIRQALIALSDSAKVWRELFLYRFESGDFSGHNFGNIFLTVLEKITQNYEKSIQLAQQVLKTKGHVIPITLGKTNINAQLDDGSIIKTEALIDQKVKRAKINKLYLEKDVPVNPRALNCLRNAEVIVVGPGDLFTSVLPSFMFKDFVHAYNQSQAKKVLVLNLMNKLGQTDNFKSSDFFNTYATYLQQKPFDYLVINNAPIPEEVKQLYFKSGESEVINDLKTSDQFTILEGNLVSDSCYEQKAGDILERSLIRHDSQKLAEFLWQEIIR